MDLDDVEDVVFEAWLFEDLRVVLVVPFRHALDTSNAVSSQLTALPIAVVDLGDFTLGGLLPEVGSVRSAWGEVVV